MENLVKLKAAKCVTEPILFFSTLIHSTMRRCVKYHFEYDNKCIWDKVKHETIMLPVDINGDQNWDYMEEYMKKVQEKVKLSSG